MVQIIEYNGEEHEFPDNFTDDEISSALSSLDNQEPVQQAQPVKQPNQANEDIYNSKLATARNSGDAGIGRTIMNNLGQGVFGLGDEVSSVLGAAYAKGHDLITGENSGNWSDLLKEASDIQQADIKAGMEQHPAYAIGSQLVGGAAGLGLASKAPIVGKYVKTAMDSLGTGGVGGRIAKNLAFGAATGGAYGAGTAEDGNRLQGAKNAAVSGAVVGAALPAVGAAVKGVYNITTAPSKTIAKLAKIDPKAAQDFLDSGVQSSLSALSNSPSIKLLDKTLSKFPGGAGVIQKSTNQTLDDIKAIIDKQTPMAADAETAGAITQKGLAGYKNRVMQAGNKGLDRLERYINPDDGVQANNSLKLLNELTQKFSATPELQKDTLAQEAAKKLISLSKDVEANGGVIPYKAIKKYRTDIGEIIGSPTLTTGQGELKQAYGALTMDMRQAFESKGGQALAAFDNYNSKYKAAMDRIDTFLQPIFAKKTPEQAFQAAFSGSDKGSTQLKNILGSLKPAERKVVVDTFMNKLGTAKASAQNAEGTVFSVDTYLTNWSKLSDKSKNVMFGNDSRRAALDKVSSIVSRLKENGNYTNYSNTAPNITTGGLLLSAAMSPMTGGTSLVAGGSAILTANATARLMTSKSFVNWLARAAAQDATPKNIATSINQLKHVAHTNPDIAPEIAKYTTYLGAILSKGKESTPVNP